MSEGREIDRDWELGFELEVKAQRHAELMLLVRGIAILLVVAVIAIVRAAVL